MPYRVLCIWASPLKADGDRLHPLFSGTQCHPQGLDDLILVLRLEFRKDR